MSPVADGYWTAPNRSHPSMLTETQARMTVGYTTAQLGLSDS
jgi:hypothetical protein